MASSIATTYTASIWGIEAYLVTVEVESSSGASYFNVVGLPDNIIKESRDRISAALNYLLKGFHLNRIIVNLAPVDLKKQGTGFDLPLAVAILAASGHFQKEKIKNYLLIGEVSLKGELRSVQGVLSILLSAKAKGITKVILPEANHKEASLVTGLEIFVAENLKQVIDFFSYDKELVQVTSQKIKVELPYHTEDLNEVKGQDKAKRALEIAASGNHNILLCGPPGTGKTMLAKRLKTILPPLNTDESLELIKIHSSSGSLKKNGEISSERPFRSPHHTISAAGLIGGGSYPKAGEASLAHNGVLFLDELPEFQRNTLENLRQPMESKEVIISRAQISVKLPTRFLLVTAMNPCPCGYHGSSLRQCSCTPYQVQKYRSKISGPLLDRIDLQVEMPHLSFDEMQQTSKELDSATIFNRVTNALNLQKDRYQQSPSKTNSDMTRKQLDQFCELDKDCVVFLRSVMEKRNFSSRAYDRILKISRTIADLEQKEKLEIQHLAEAVHYRFLDKQELTF